jgi:site-specific recombinase XerD
MIITEAIEKMLIALLAGGVKRETEKWYRVRLARFLSIYGKWEIDKVDIDVVRGYIVWLRNEKISPHYFYSHVRVVRRLFKWLYEERWIDEPFWKTIKLPSLPQPKPKAIEISDVEKLLEGCCDDIPGRRNRAIILFLLDTGCRVGGLCKLKIGDVDFEKRSAVLNEKGGKRKSVLFVERTLDEMQKWLLVKPYQENEFVFTSLVDDLPMNPNSVIQMLRRLKTKTGVNGRVNPHSFRHAFAREYLKNGGDLASVSDLLGHSQIIVTKQNYAVFLQEEHQAKHEAYSPVSKLDI